MRQRTEGELARRLRECSKEDLPLLLEQHLGELNPKAARAALRNPFAGRAVVDLLMTQRRLLTSHKVCRDIVSHPKSPETVAVNLVGHLFWRDLAAVAANARVRPRVRRAADLQLAKKLPRLAIGEKMSLARMGGQGVQQRLRHDPTPRVVAALLENPRLTIGVLMPLLTNDAARPEILELVATHAKWSRRYEVRLAVARNPRTPAAVALSQLAMLKKADLRELLKERRLNTAVRQRATLLLGSHSNRNI